jgi:hypothetical protein
MHDLDELQLIVQVRLKPQDVGSTTLGCEELVTRREAGRDLR